MFSIVQVNAKSGIIGERGDSWYTENDESTQYHDIDFDSIFPGDTVTVVNKQVSVMGLPGWFTTAPVAEVCQVEEDKVCFRCTDGALYFLYRLH